MKVSAMLCLGALALAAATESEYARSSHRRVRRAAVIAQPRFSVSHLVEGAKSGSMSMADLEMLAEAHGMSMVEGELYLFSKNEVLASRESLAGIVDDVTGWFSGLGSKIKDGFDKAWTNIKGKFTGAEAPWSESIEKAVSEAGMSEEEKKGLAQAVDTAKDKNDAASKKSLYQALIDILTSTKTIEAISMFCRGVACLWEPEYRTCSLISPFKDLKKAIDKQAASRTGPAKWSDVAITFMKKAALRILIHGLAVAVRAAKVALDSLPGGSAIEGWVDSIYETCNIMISGDAASIEAAEDKDEGEPFLVGSACFVEQIKKIAEKLRTLINHIKERKFKQLVVELGKDETVNMLTPANMFTPGALVKCMIDKSRKEVEATMTCTKKAADIKADEWAKLEVEKPTTEPVFFF